LETSGRPVRTHDASVLCYLDVGVGASGEDGVVSPGSGDSIEYHFGDVVVQPASHRVLKDGVEVPLEPKALAVLVELLRHPQIVVERDQLLDRVWGHSFVTPGVLNRIIALLRKALGDDGKEQRLLRTVPKRGFRFVASVRTVTAGSAGGEVALRAAPHPIEAASREPADRIALIATDPGTRAGRPSLAILPFARLNDDEPVAIAADGIPSELIAELARLRWLFVIARGSSFNFRSFESSPQQVRAALNVRYCVSGSVSLASGRIELAIELSDLESGDIVWAENYAGPAKQLHEFRTAITRAVVSAIEEEIPQNEALRARLVDPEQLTTWERYHLGIQHLNKFGADDLQLACRYFEQAIAAEPNFARAHAALSAASFQLAFQRLSRDEAADSRRAREHAERGVLLDPRDPFTNFAMGRVHWLENDVLSSQGWLARATSLSPSSARSHYAHGWSDAILANYDLAESRVSLALELSPLDPFRYGMLGVHAFNCLGRGDYEAGARWSSEAAVAPGAHALIAMIAVAAHQLSGDKDAASRWAALARKRHSAVSRAHFFRAFPFVDTDLRRLLDGSLKKQGL